MGKCNVPVLYPIPFWGCHFSFKGYKSGMTQAYNYPTYIYLKRWPFGWLKRSHVDAKSSSSVCVVLPLEVRWMVDERYPSLNWIQLASLLAEGSRYDEYQFLRLMEEILHHLECTKPMNWCRISSINSMITYPTKLTARHWCFWAWTMMVFPIFWLRFFGGQPLPISPVFTLRI